MGKRVLGSGLSRLVFPKGETRETVLNQPSPQQLALPFYNLLPKTPLETLRWKYYVRKRCHTDLDFRAVILDACRRDVCFYADTLCWIFEPRPPVGPCTIPLCLYPDQADVLTWIDECYGVRDLGAGKTRGIGFSWTWAVESSHKLYFDPGAKLAVSTKDEATLFGPDCNFLMGKAVYVHQNMPSWLRYTPKGQETVKVTADNKMIRHLYNDVSIQGFAPTDAKKRSLRFTWSFEDEAAFYPRNADENINSASGTTNSRLYGSTFHGPDNLFYSLMFREKSTMLRVFSYWWNNPERWAGCYTWEHGRVKIIDTSYKFPAGYEFVHDPRFPSILRSPWVDTELARAGADSTMQIAIEELFGIQAERGRKVFRPTVIEIANETCQNPREAEVVGGEKPTLRFGHGPVKVWGDVGEGKSGPFKAGCDLGEGMGAAYSTLEVVNMRTGEQVMEIAINTLGYVEFAQLVVRALRWINGGKGDEWTELAFEQNGRAKAFGQELVRVGYGHIRKSKYATKVPKGEDETYLGVRNTDGGMAWLSEMDRAILDGELTIRSDALANEINEFTKNDEGNPAYPRGADGHGDRAQAMGIAWFLMKGNAVDRAETDARAAIKSELESALGESQSSYSDYWTLSPGGILY